MAFESILYAEDGEAAGAERTEAPECFGDLNLDQVVEAITAGKEEYDLTPFFYTPLQEDAAIRYRQEVMQELEQPQLREQIEAFAQAMRAMRGHLAQAKRLYHKRQRERWLVDAVAIYCDAVQRLAENLAGGELRSSGLLGLRAYVTAYAASERFGRLAEETKKVQATLATVQYCMAIQGNNVTVRAYAGERDYGAVVQQTFARFAQGATRDYRVSFSGSPELNQVEGLILDRVEWLFADVFGELAMYCERNRGYLDEVIGRFDREVQFYLAYLAYAARFKRRGLPFCYPQLAQGDKDVFCRDGYDVALAYKLDIQNVNVVCNDFWLAGSERILVVSGPNQGGKTTFARSFGQLHYLASLGCPTPGREARLFLCDRIFTHFETEENIGNLRGKLEDDLVRIHQILVQATPRSIVIMNEIFTSTALQDAIYLGKRVMERIMALDALCVYVTFVEELATLSEKTVSMVSTVAAENPAQRTYRLVRRHPDGLAYALSLAEKHRLSYASLKERMRA